MKILKYKYILSAALLSTMLGVTSCVNDLDTVPLDKDELVSDVVFGKEIGAYEQSLAKIYAGLVIGGNAGGDSDQDVVALTVVLRLHLFAYCGICRNWLLISLIVAGMILVFQTSIIFLGLLQVHGSKDHIIVCIIRLTCQMRFYVKQLMITCLTRLFRASKGFY